MATCKDRVENVFPNYVYQLRQKRFDKFDPLCTTYWDDQKLFKKLAKIDFE